MSQITRKWITDGAVDHTKVDRTDIYYMAGLDASSFLAVDATTALDAMHIRGTDGTVGIRLDLDAGSGRSFQLLSHSDGSMLIRDADAAAGVGQNRLIIGATGIVQVPSPGSLQLATGVAVSSLSTDTSLGGIFPSDTALSTQKAVKAYVDAQVAVENLWDRTSTALYTSHAGDDINVTRVITPTIYGGTASIFNLGGGRDVAIICDATGGGPGIGSISFYKSSNPLVTLEEITSPYGATKLSIDSGINAVAILDINSRNSNPISMLSLSADGVSGSYMYWDRDGSSLRMHSAGDTTFEIGSAVNTFIFGTSSATYMTLSRYFDIGPAAYARQLQINSSGTDNAYLKLTSAGIYSSLFFEVGGQSQARLQTFANSMSLSSRSDSTFVSNYAGASSTGNFVFNTGSGPGSFSFIRNGDSLMVLDRITSPYTGTNLKIQSYSTDVAALTIETASSSPVIYFNIASATRAQMAWTDVGSKLAILSYGDTTFMNNFGGAGTGNYAFLGSSSNMLMSLFRQTSPTNATVLKIDAVSTDYAELKINSLSTNAYLYFTVGGTTKTSMGWLNSNNRFYATSTGDLQMASYGDSTFIANITNTGNGTFLFRNYTTEVLSITSAGVVKIPNLAGSGSRTVVADSNGVLSTAP